MEITSAELDRIVFALRRLTEKLRDTQAPTPALMLIEHLAGVAPGTVGVQGVNALGNAASSLMAAAVVFKILEGKGVDIDKLLEAL